MIDYLPFHVDVPMYRWPIMNWVIIGITAIAFLPFLGILMALQETELSAYLSSPGILLGGHLLIHADLMHLIGNMFFLWIFGNAICAKVGNLYFPIIYYCLGMVAIAMHTIFSGVPGVGASGAINGIVGMFLIWYPLNEMSIFYVLGGRFAGTWHVASYWLILVWFVFDIWGALSGQTGIGYWAHIGGFVSGASLAVVLQLTRLIEMDDGERSLVDILSSKEPDD